jgi:hypothetical protein
MHLVQWCVVIPWLFALAVCIVSMVVLALLVLLIWQGWLQHLISLDRFHKIRKYVALFVVLYATLCVWRLTKNVAIPRDLKQEFLPELIAYSIFWVLAPPIWFFVEYFAVASDWIHVPPANREEYVKTIKDYADYASKIWAGVLALLLALIALKK